MSVLAILVWMGGSIKTYEHSRALGSGVGAAAWDGLLWTLGLGARLALWADLWNIPDD